MMLVNAATMAANTATLAHNQFRAATTSQALKPMNTSDASTSADFPRRAEPEPDYRCGGHHVPGDACVVPTLDVYRKNGAPGGRSHGVVVGCRCPSAPQG
jgi:hypothetical protein